MIVDDLIRLAGHRPQPDAAATARVRAVVEAEWRREHKSRSRSWRWWAMAAAIVPVVLALGLWARSNWPTPIETTPPAAVATVARMTGGVSASARDAALRTLRIGDVATAGARVQTDAGGRALFQLDGGRSIRIDVHTAVVFVSPTRVRLERGRVYVDSGGDAPASAGLEVETRHGLARDIGTQFEVTADDAASQVRVREGVVRLESRETTVTIAALETARIDEAARVVRGTTTKHGATWAWLEKLAPQFQIEGATLDRFLNWVSREQGWTWQYLDAAAVKLAKSVVLHGSIEGLTPSEALDAVLPTCGMQHELRRDKLIVSIASR